MVRANPAFVLTEGRTMITQYATNDAVATAPTVQEVAASSPNPRPTSGAVCTTAAAAAKIAQAVRSVQPRTPLSLTLRPVMMSARQASWASTLTAVYD